MKDPIANVRVDGAKTGASVRVEHTPTKHTQKCSNHKIKNEINN